MEAASSAVWTKAFAPLVRDLSAFDGSPAVSATPEFLAAQVEKLLHSHARLTTLVKWTSVLVRLTTLSDAFSATRKAAGEILSVPLQAVDINMVSGGGEGGGAPRSAGCLTRQPPHRICSCLLTRR